MKQNSFLQGAILPSILRFSIPLVLALLLQALYGAVDLWVVGQFDSTAGVAAVATGGQIMHSVTCIITGLTTGVTVLVGQAMGGGHRDKVAKITAAMIKLFAVLAVVITVVMIASAEKIAVAMNMPEEAFDKTVSYLRICSAGTVFITAYNAISGLFRGLGNSKSPLLFIAIACMVNIVADLIFVGVFHLGASGAAMATVLAQCSSVVFSLLYMRKQKMPFQLTRASFYGNGSGQAILKLGAPIALQDVLTSISFLIITSIVNVLGVEESAAVGISEKLFIFMALAPLTFMSAMATFVAHNIGAGQPQRAKSGLFQACGVSLVCGILVFLVAFFHGEMLVSLFEKTPSVIKKGVDYLKACSFEQLIIALQFCILGYFNGLGKTRFVMVQGLFTAFCLRIPLSYYFSTRPDTSMFQIGLAVPISAMVGLALTVFYFLYLEKKEGKKLHKEM